MHPLGRRERQILDILYRRGRATAAEVRALLGDPPTYSAVRAALRVLEQKGYVQHRRDGPRYLFVPSVPRERAKRSALRHILETFFEGSPGRAAAALLGGSAHRLSAEDLNRIQALIDKARAKERKPL